MRLAERFVLGALLMVTGALLAACGNGGGTSVGTTAGTPGATTSSSASSPASSGARHVVTVSQNTPTVTVKVGETLVVQVPPGGMPRAFFNVQPGGEKVLTPVAGGKNARQAEFRAAAPGEAIVAVSGGPSCSPGQMCPAIRTLVGHVQVHVTP